MDEHDWSKYRWWRTQVKTYADFSSLNSLQHADMAVNMKKDGNTIKVTLSNSSPVVAFFIRMTLKDAEGEIVVPSFWSDNLVTLAPGQELTYTCNTPQPECKTLEISGWNIDNKTIEIL